MAARPIRIAALLLQRFLFVFALALTAWAIGRTLTVKVWDRTEVATRMSVDPSSAFFGIQYVRRQRDGVVEIYGRSKHLDPYWNDFSSGLGFVHAMDRGMQLLMMRIIAAGNLCSREKGFFIACDPKMRELDRWMKQLHFGRVAKEQAAVVEKNDPKAFKFVQAYADGINERWRNAGLPLEMRIMLGFPEEEEWKWTVEDTMLVSQFYSYVGMAQTQEEAERFIIEAVQHGARGTAFVKSLFYPHLEPLTDDIELLTSLRALNLSANEFHAPTLLHALNLGYKASNSWAVNSNFTRSPVAGADETMHAAVGAILASDPHAQVNRLPGLLQEVIFHRGGSPNEPTIEHDFIAGVSIPAQPTIGMGRSKHLAWALTYGYVDSTEFIVEKCRFNAKSQRNECIQHSPESEEQHQSGQTEENVRWMAVESEEVVLPHGPFSPDVRRFIHRIPSAGGAVLDITTPSVELGKPHEERLILSRTIPWNAKSPAAWLGALRAANLEVPAKGRKIVEMGADVVRNMEMPLNFILADVDGHIAMQQSGLFAKHENTAVAALPSLRWRLNRPVSPHVPVSELTRVVDPPEGFLAVTNERGYDQQGINLHMGPYRQTRIENRLADLLDWTARTTNTRLPEEQISAGKFATKTTSQKRKSFAELQAQASRFDAERDRLNAATGGVTVSAMRELQIDVYSIQAEKFMTQAILPVLKQQPFPESAALRALKEWDFRYTVDSSGATVFEQVYTHALRALVDFGLGNVDCPNCKHGSLDGGAGAHVSNSAWELLREGIIPGVYHHYFDNLLLTWPAELEGVGWPNGLQQSEFWTDHVSTVLTELASENHIQRWGDVNCAPWNNLLIDGHLGPLGTLIGLDAPCVPMFGSRACISQTHNFVLGDLGQIASAPMWRMVTDLHDPAGTQSVLAGGASDRWLSPYYLSDVDLWAKGQYKPLIR